MEEQLLKIITHLKEGTISENEARNALLLLLGVSQQRKLLLAFCRFATPIYWGENEYTEYEQLIEPFLKANNCG